MKLLFKCRKCREDKTAKAFIKGHEYECRKCMKETLKLLEWEVKEYKRILS